MSQQCHTDDVAIVERMANVVFDLVRERDYITFVEIQNHLTKRGLPAAGDHAMELTNCPNVFLWIGLSPELLAAIKLVLDSRRLFIHPASVFSYFVDGRVLTWPIAKSKRKGGYTKPRWLPVCFRTVPPRHRTRKTEVGEHVA